MNTRSTINASITKNKSMPKQKRLHLSIGYKLRSLVIVLAAAGVVGGAAIVHADQFDAQINALQSQNNATQSQLNSLAAQATSYQDAINLLNSQIASIEQAMADNQAKQVAVEQQIAADQQEVTLKKGQLSATIKAMYIDGQTTTIEELATSKDLSDYVDKEQYRTDVQNQLNDKIQAIALLENQLHDQKTSLDILIASETTQNAQLSAAQTQQNQLLAYNQGQQSAFNQQLAANQSQIQQLRAEQIAANTSSVLKTLSRGNCGGGYPNYLCNAAQDSLVDPWHMYNRECVSYTAWRASEESPVANALLQTHSFGNAGDWPANAVRYGASVGVTVSTTPHVGDIAIRPAIPGVSVAPGEPDVGHAMYVEAVNGDGTITVSEFNEYLDGTYSEEIRAVAGNYHGSFYQLQFIHFPR